jgi:hypothetical protein
MIHTKQYLKTLKAVTCLAALTTSAHAAIIYSENFRNHNADSLNSLGWGVHVESSAKTNAGGPAVSNWVMLIGAGGGATGEIENINAGSVFGPTDSRTSLRNNTGTNQTAISWTSEYIVDTSVNAINSISFYIGNSSPSINTRVAIRINGSWYASAATFTNAASSVFEAKTLTWTNSSTSWHSLTNDGSMTINSGNGLATTIAGTSLALGSLLQSELPNGNITAFGLFFDSIPNAGTARTDYFQIDATPIPEPSSYAALCSLAILGFVALRRRR